MSTVTIIEYCAAVSIAGNGSVQTSDGDVFKPGATIVAAGWESFALLESCLGPDCGTGVKGQAALLRPSEAVDPLSPIIYDDGVYAITHGNGLVAVGSTSENDFSDPFSTDGKLDDLIAKAARACPALTESQIIERWAGIRPKASGRDPLVGRLPGTASTIIATGGFKITFGIAHLMAKAALALAASEEPAFLPASFRPENRLRPRSG
jgi:glycine/D-amino acid oxidase-like deaminating enzyme